MRFRQAFDKAPRHPVAETSYASSSKENLRFDLLFPGHILALRGMGIYAKDSAVVWVCSKALLRVRDASAGSSIPVKGWARAIRIDARGNGDMRFGQTSEGRAKFVFSFRGDPLALGRHGAEPV